MRLVITDTGYTWNIKNPFLKQFKDIVLVVCLNGKEVTDEYECFTVPAEKYPAVGLGQIPFSEGSDFRALESVAWSLSSRLTHNDDIVFLTDNEPSTLYPYYVLKEICMDNRLHLVANSPLHFMTKSDIKVHEFLLKDLSKLDSLFYYDTNKKVREMEGTNITLWDFFEKTLVDELGKLMPRILNGIYHMENPPCFFDFASMEYVSLKGGFEEIDLANRDKKVKGYDFPVTKYWATLGIPLIPSYPEEGEEIKETIERPVIRLDGKKVCNVLREQRILLAKANGIPFESVECPSMGPCAGTCQKCDEESAYLASEMSKIPKKKRVYPKFNPAWEVSE